MVQIYEGDPSRESLFGGDSPSVDWNWVVLDTRDDLLVKRLVAATTPPAYDGLFLQTIAAKEIAPEAWECRAHYGVIKPGSSDTYKFSFDTTGGTQHITQSLETVIRYGRDGVGKATDHKGAIGVTDHDVAGCDIVVPKFAWQETWQLPLITHGWLYSQALKLLTGKTNAANFRGFPIGQVLFYGARGSASSKDPDLIEITFNFGQSDDMDAQTIGEIQNVIKNGWQYLWVHYMEAHDETAKSIARRADGVYIERVYKPDDFSLLGIGT